MTETNLTDSTTPTPAHARDTFSHLLHMESPLLEIQGVIALLDALGSSDLAIQPEGLDTLYNALRRAHVSIKAEWDAAIVAARHQREKAMRAGGAQ